MSKAGLQPGNQVSKAKLNQVFFRPVSLWPGQTLEPQLLAALALDKLRADLHTVFSICLTLYILLCSLWGWAWLALLVPTPVGCYQCGPHFCATLPWCECLSADIRMMMITHWCFLGSSWLSGLMGYLAILAVLVNCKDGEIAIGTMSWHRLCMKGCFFFIVLSLPPSLNIQKIKGSKGAASVLWLNRFLSNAFFCCQWPSFALQAGPAGKISFSW